MKYLLSFILFTLSFISYADQYLCIADASTGFTFDKASKKWKQTNFRVNDNKYIISSSKSESSTYQIKKMGSDFVFSFCTDDFNEYGYLYCGDFKFNKDNGRFINTYTTGYFNVLPKVNEITDESGDTPYIEIGKCSSF
jgi:hypothetical protein